jgi:hypothetical protein
MRKSLSCSLFLSYGVHYSLLYKWVTSIICSYWGGWGLKEGGCLQVEKGKTHTQNQMSLASIYTKRFSIDQ